MASALCGWKRLEERLQAPRAPGEATKPEKSRHPQAGPGAGWARCPPGK